MPQSVKCLLTAVVVAGACSLCLCFHGTLQSTPLNETDITIDSDFLPIVKEVRPSSACATILLCCIMMAVCSG